MKRTLLVGGGIVAGFVLVATIVAAAVTPRIREPRTVTVVERAATDVVVDIGKDGDSTGDILTFHNKLYQKGEVVGRDQGTCIRINTQSGTWQCSFTSFLRGGQITVEGPFYDGDNSTLAVTGGTGVFANVRGSMDLISRAGGTKFEFAFHLLP